MKPFILIVCYLCVVALPPVLSWMTGGPMRPLRHEIASGLGMLAFAMFLAEFVLSGRFKSISNDIGMDVTMRFHQLMARLLLVFAMLHPLLYRGLFLGEGQRLEPDNLDFAGLATGIAAYLLLPSLVLLAIGRNQLGYKYETWRLMHAFGALLIAVLMMHHTIHTGHYAATPAVAALWKAMTGIAVATIIYVYVVGPLRQLRHKWQVTGVKRLTPRQWHVTIQPVGHAGLQYQAGQFAWLNLGHSPFSVNENPFSISSAPAEGPGVSFVIKELGDFTNKLDQIAPGTRAYLDGPHGSLTIDGRTEPGVALIAGGVGIAPMLSILRQMRLTDDLRQRKLIYGNRSQDQIVFPDELSAEATTHVLSEPPEDWHGETGMISATLLDKVFTADEFNNWLFVLCGPPPMLTAVEAHLRAKGTPPAHILSERFDYD